MPRPPKNFASRAEWRVLPCWDAERLAKRVGIDLAVYPLEKLEKHLDTAGGLYRSIRRKYEPTARNLRVGLSLNEPTPRERRERLDLIEKELRALRAGRLDRSAALALALLRSPGCLGVLAYHVEHCFDRDPVLDGALAVLPIRFTDEQLARIEEEVERARRHLRRRFTASRGTRSDPGLRMLVRELGAIWTEATGRRPTWSNNWDTARRTGPFVEFLQDVCWRLGVEKSAHGLVELHRAWNK